MSGVITVSAVHVYAVVREINAADVAALIELYHATNGPEWKPLKRWDVSKAPGTWQGVKWAGGRVV
jgi:hypothetical protein